MGGILGLWRLDGRPSGPYDLAPMAAAMRHRGCQEGRSWSNGSLSLGHLHRPACPAVGTQQPRIGPGERFVVTSDARIDNRAELLTNLGEQVRNPAQVADDEIVSGCHAKWGAGAAGRMLGAFAYVVWDRDRAELRCVRDHFGVKPLFYCHVPGRLFAFASEIAALLALPEVPREIDDREVGRHLYVRLGSDPCATYYRHIRRVPPAHSLTMSARGLRETRYWTLEGSGELKLRSTEEYAAAVREVFVESVRCRLPAANAPVATLLSGGIDSSAITCVAAGLRRDRGAAPIHTFSAVFPDTPDEDEREYIDDILGRHPLSPRFLEADRVDPLEHVDEVMRRFGGPMLGKTWYINWRLYELAGESGARVLLDGYDGDATVSHGRTYLSELAAAGRWFKLATISYPFSRRRGASPVADYLALVRFVRAGRRRGQRPVASPVPRMGSDLVPIDRGFAGRFSEDELRSPEPVLSERQAHVRHLTSHRLVEPLGWLEVCGAAHGLEARFPFFDVRLAELCVSLPGDQKIRGGWTRYVMRRAMEGILPPRIQWRDDKADFRPGWSHALRTFAGPRLRSVLHGHRADLAQYLDVDAAQSMLERFLYSDDHVPEQSPLWRALSLALWLTTA